MRRCAVAMRPAAAPAWLLALPLMLRTVQRAQRRGVEMVRGWRTQAQALVQVRLEAEQKREHVVRWAASVPG